MQTSGVSQDAAQYVDRGGALQEGAVQECQAPQALEFTQTAGGESGAQGQLRQDTCLFPRKETMGVFGEFPP